MQWHSRSFTTASLFSITVCFSPRRVTFVVTQGFLGQEQGYAGGPDPANREAYASSHGVDRRF